MFELIPHRGGTLLASCLDVFGDSVAHDVASPNNQFVCGRISVSRMGVHRVEYVAGRL